MDRRRGASAVQGRQPAGARTHEGHLEHEGITVAATSPPGQLNPSPRLLLGPGPCDAHPRVLTAMTTPLLGHLDPQFLDIMTETQEMLRQVYQTRNVLTFPVSATGMAGMETCLVNM